MVSSMSSPAPVLHTRRGRPPPARTASARDPSAPRRRARGAVDRLALAARPHADLGRRARARGRAVARGARRAGRLGAAVPGRPDAVLREPDGSRPRDVPDPDAGDPARARSGHPRRGAPRPARRGLAHARAVGGPQVPRSRAVPGRRSLRHLLPPLQPPPPGRRRRAADHRRARGRARLHRADDADPRRAAVRRRSAAAVDPAPRSSPRPAARDPARRDDPDRHAAAGGVPDADRRGAGRRARAGTIRCSSTPTSTTSRS